VVTAPTVSQAEATSTAARKAAAQEAAAAADALAQAQAAAQADDLEGFEPLYPSLPAWVEHHFTQTYAWRVSEHTRWCVQWWDHPEAIVRLNVLWQLWELARLEQDPAAMGSWLRDWLDRLLPPLTAITGPFCRCSVELQPNGAPWDHVPSRPLPTSAAPAELWAPTMATVPDVADPVAVAGLVVGAAPREGL